MKRKLFFYLFLVLLLVTLSGSLQAQSRRESEVFDLVNQERSRAGLGTLTWDDRLGGLAREYSRQMARDNFFGHADPDGKTVVDRANAAHIKDWASIGENLFFCEATPNFAKFAIVGWMKSKTHKDNILDTDWNFSGIGIATSNDGTIYITQVFTRKLQN